MVNLYLAKWGWNNKYRMVVKETLSKNEYCVVMVLHPDSFYEPGHLVAFSDYELTPLMEPNDILKELIK